MNDNKFWYWSVVCAVALALVACGRNQTLEESIDCSQFKRSPDGTWSATDASLDYIRNGTRYQMNYTGTIVPKEGTENAAVVAALDRKCTANK